jgi:hypothetical protein
MTVVLLSTSEVKGWQQIGRTVLVRSFTHSRGSSVNEYLESAARARLHDANVSATERARVDAMLRRRRR